MDQNYSWLLLNSSFRLTRNVWRLKGNGSLHCGIAIWPTSSRSASILAPGLYCFNFPQDRLQFASKSAVLCFLFPHWGSCARVGNPGADWKHKSRAFGRFYHPSAARGMLPYSFATWETVNSHNGKKSLWKFMVWYFNFEFSHFIVLPIHVYVGCMTITFDALICTQWRTQAVRWMQIFLVLSMPAADKMGLPSVWVLYFC